MSAGSPNRGRDLSEFERMDTGTLEGILRLDLEAPEQESLNVDTIIYITKILEERRKNDPSYSPVNVDQAWAEFNEKYRPYHFDGHSLYDDEENENASPNHLSVVRPAPARAKRRIVRWMGTIAAVLCIVLLAGTAAASAMGYDVWGAVVQWTGETFQFAGGEQEPPGQNGEGTAALEDALADYDLEPNGLVPAWLPEGYELDSIHVDESPMCVKILADYRNDDGQWMRADIKYFRGGSASIHERDILNAELYRAGGREYYIFSNEGKETVVWVDGQCECSMVCDLTKTDLYKMIDSIHRE